MKASQAKSYLKTLWLFHLRSCGGNGWNSKFRQPPSHIFSMTPTEKDGLATHRRSFGMKMSKAFSQVLAFFGSHMKNNEFDFLFTLLIGSITVEVFMILGII